VSPLINLELVARFSPVADSVKNWLSQDEYVHFVLDVQRDLPRRTELQLQLLKHIALDATFGTRREDFMLEDRTGLETTFVLHLYRRDNFLGAELTLDNDSAEYRKMVAAIDANLASRMFKAALMAVRLGNIVHARRFAERARERAVARARAAQTQRLVIQPGAGPLSEGAVQSEAFLFWRKSVDANTARRWARIGKIERHTSDSLMQGNADAAMLLFALEYLIPKELQ
jgi:hypothetical protein